MIMQCNSIWKSWYEIIEDVTEQEADLYISYM